MLKHEFGIMQKDPERHKRYDRYEPEKYSCISVDDDLIEPLLEKLSEVKCYHHTPDKAGYGLAYTGVTLIPPESCGAVIETLGDNIRLSELRNLLLKAGHDHKYIIHFGI